jgi:glutamate synthase domain-containing protein 3
MSGFMMQRGTIIVCGDAADGLGDSMYEGRIFVGGTVASFGADAEEREVTDQDRMEVREALAPHGIESGGIDFTKIESGRRLWNFDKKEAEIWKDAL